MFLKEFRNVLTTLLKGGLDIMGDSVGRGELNVGSSGCKKLDKFSVFDDEGGPVALRNPLDNMSATYLS